MSVQSGGYSIGLDRLRIISAFLVVATHLRASLFVDWAQVDSQGVVAKLFYFSTSLGSQAVTVFFVLSGFLVGGGLVRRSSFTWVNYLASRLVRLWVVLVPALLVSAVLLGVATDEFLSGGFRAAWVSGPMPGSESCSPLVWVANIFFLQKIFAPVFCNNGPLWSLSYEFWYYILFPLVWIGFLRRRFEYLVFAVVLASIFGPSVMWGFVYWCFGVGASVLSGYLASRGEHISCKGRYLLLALSVPLAVIVLLFGKVGLVSESNPFLYGIPLALAFACLIASFSPSLVSKSGLKTDFLGGVTRRLSESSFSLYVLHFPIICALVPRIVPAQFVVLNTTAMTHFASMFLLCVSSAIAFASCSEWKTPELRRWVMNRLEKV